MGHFPGVKVNLVVALGSPRLCPARVGHRSGDSLGTPSPLKIPAARGVPPAVGPFGGFTGSLAAKPDTLGSQRCPQSSVPHIKPPWHTRPCRPKYLRLPGFIPTAGELCSPPACMGDQQLLLLPHPAQQSRLGTPGHGSSSRKSCNLLFPFFFFFSSSCWDFPPYSASKEYTASASFPAAAPASYGDFPSPSPRLGRAEPPSVGDEVSQIPK